MAYHRGRQQRALDIRNARERANNFTGEDFLNHPNFNAVGAVKSVAKMGVAILLINLVALALMVGVVCIIVKAVFF